MKNIRWHWPLEWCRCYDCGLRHLARRSDTHWTGFYRRVRHENIYKALDFLQPNDVPFLSFIGNDRRVTDDLVPLPPHEEMCGEGRCNYAQHDYGVNPSTGSHA